MIKFLRTWVLPTLIAMTIIVGALFLDAAYDVYAQPVEQSRPPLSWIMYDEAFTAIRVIQTNAVCVYVYGGYENGGYEKGGVHVLPREGILTKGCQ